MAMCEQYEVVLQFGPNQVKGHRFSNAERARRQAAMLSALYPEARVAYRSLRQTETVMLSLDEIVFEDDADIDTDTVSLEELECVSDSNPGTAVLSIGEIEVEPERVLGTAMLSIDEIVFSDFGRPRKPVDLEVTRMVSSLYEDQTRPEVQLPDQEDHPPFY